MAGDDAYGDADRASMRELFRDMEDLGRRLDRMSDKLEEVAVLTSTVSRNTEDIAGMREDLSAKKITERIAVLEAYMRGANGDLSTNPRWWAALVTGIGLLLIGLLQVLQWLGEMAGKLR